MMTERKEINGNTAKEIFEAMFDSDVSPRQYAQEKGLQTVNDEGLLRGMIGQIMDANPQSVEDYRNGKE